MNSWTNGYYHDSTGKILGSFVPYGDKYKAMLDSIFIGWFISEDHAKAAVESAHAAGFEPLPFSTKSIERSLGAKYVSR